MRSDILTAVAYFSQLPPDRKAAVERIKACIVRLWPAVKEDMAYGIPTYSLDGRPLFALASQKHFVVFYVIPYDLLDAFKHELVMYNCGKSCIRFRQVDDEALALLDRVVRFIGATHAESRVRLKPMMKAIGPRRRSEGMRDPILAPVTGKTIVPSAPSGRRPVWAEGTPDA